MAYALAPVGPDAVGGAEQVLSAIDRALVAAGHRSIVVACRGSVVAGEWVDTGVDAAGRIDDAARGSAQEATRRAVASVARDADLVHLHGLDFDSVVPPCGAVLATLHLPAAWYRRSVWETRRTRFWLHGVSLAQARDLPMIACVLPPIGNGVAVDALQRTRHARRDFALTLGRICHEKGQHLALQAARHAGVRLLIGGSLFGYEAHRAYYEHQVAPLLDEWRRFLGPLPFARKRRLLSAARCLLVPSLAAETSSLVAMEAAACGTPVIAFRAGALADIVVDGETGFLVDDAHEMAARIDDVACIDPERCRALARAHFPIERMTDGYLERYRVLASA